MFHDPNVGDIVQLDGRAIKFCEAPGAPGVVYAEIGRKAKVYRVLRGEQSYALKAFKPNFRGPNIVRNSELLARLQGTPGLRVAERLALKPESFPQVTKKYPDLAYSVLMPWIEGQVWGKYIIDKTPISPDESVRLAQALINVLASLEQQSIAHCDLSGGNFIFSEDYRRVELIDIEDLFAVDFEPPKPIPAGTSGYAPGWARQSGLWQANADRFAAGIIICEILAWQFADVRQASEAETLFGDGEFGHSTRRFGQVSERLEQLHPELSRLFGSVWNAQSLQECPAMAAWKDALEQIEAKAAAPGWVFEPLGVPGDLKLAPKTPPEVRQVQSESVVRPEQPLSQPPAAVSQPTPLQRPALPFFKDQSDKWEPLGKTPATPPAQSMPTSPMVEEEIVAKKWSDAVAAQSGKSQALTNVFLIYAGIGVGLAVVLLIFSSWISSINATLLQSGGYILPLSISGLVLASLVGGVQTWVFRNNIRREKAGPFFWSALLSGAAAGFLAGLVMNASPLHPLAIGALMGGLAGGASSLAQNRLMGSAGLQSRWFWFSALSWLVIWGVAWWISWQVIGGAGGMAAAGAFILICSGAAFSVFLSQNQQIEF